MAERYNKDASDNFLLALLVLALAERLAML
jgi:hypothetical protein